MSAQHEDFKEEARRCTLYHQKEIFISAPKDRTSAENVEIHAESSIEKSPLFEESIFMIGPYMRRQAQKGTSAIPSQTTISLNTA